MTKSDEFDEALRDASLGRRYKGHIPWGNTDLAITVPELVDGILEILRKEAGNGDTLVRNIPDVLSGITDNKTFNAMAFEQGGQYVIAVNHGVLFLIQDMVNRLLCLPEVFPWIGNPSLEDERRQFHPTSNDAIEYMRAFIAEPKRVLPNDPVRRDAAKLLFVAAMEFIVSHELWHILGGHVRWNASRTTEWCLAEVSNYKRLSDGIAYQALEMDADAFAVWVSLVRTLALAAASHDQGNLSRVITNPTQAVQTTLICAILMVGAFLGRTPTPSNWADLSHPPAGVRHGMNIAAADRTLQHLGEHQVRATTTGNRIWVAGFSKFVLEHIWMRIGNPERHKELLLSFGPAGTDHLLEVMRTWSTLQPELDKFSHLSLRQRMGTSV
jgi:hypothetical protein